MKQWKNLLSCSPPLQRDIKTNDEMAWLVCFNRAFKKSMIATMSSLLPASSRSLLVVVTAVLLLLLSFANAQVGVTLCACSPATYTFQLNFSFTCNDASISGAGLNRTECFVSPFGFDPENITDFVPVAINAVDIIELDQQLAPYTLTPIREDFRDGNEFKYTSITATDPNLTSATIPGGLQMNIIGVNAIDEPIQNVWIIVFNNDCGIFPIYTVGEQIGWTLMTDLTLPNAQYCPAYTASPSGSPIDPIIPSSSPTSSPTAAPSTAAPSTAAPSTAAPATDAPATIAPVTVQPTMAEPLATKAPATMAPTDRVCPPIWGKGSSEESTGKGYYSQKSSATAKGSTESLKGSTSKSGKKETGSVKSGSSMGTKSGKESSLRHTEKKSKSESKNHGEKLQKPSPPTQKPSPPPPPPSKPSPAVSEKGKSKRFRRLSKEWSSPAPSSYSSSLSKGKGYDDSSEPPVSNIYQMGSGKGGAETTGSSSMDTGKGVDSSASPSGPGKGSSVGKGYVMYDPHCYPPKKSRSSSGSQMAKPLYDGKGLSTTSSAKGGTSGDEGKGSAGAASAKGTTSADEGKGSTAASIKGSSVSKGQSGSFKAKKQSSGSTMSMSKLYSSKSKSGMSGKGGEPLSPSLKYENKKPTYHPDEEEMEDEHETEELIPATAAPTQISHNESNETATTNATESMNTTIDPNDHIYIDQQDGRDDESEVTGDDGDGIDIFGIQENEDMSYQQVEEQEDDEEKDDDEDEEEGMEKDKTKNKRRVHL